MSDSQDSPAFASPPFDHVKADVILRSSDGVDFRVFKLFLSLASPFFETLFDLPQPSEETSTDVVIRDGLPVVPVSEDGRTLNSLLRFCYPCTLAEDPKLEDFREVVDVLEAVKKYSLDGIERTVCKSLFNPQILEVNSLRCFAIACRSRMQDECVLAAKYTLREPLVPGWFQEIELITSTELLSLLTYHRRCSDALLTLKDDLTWITNEYQHWNAIPWVIARVSGSGHCGCPRSSVERNVFGSEYPTAQWWEDFMDSTFLDLRDKPCAETIKSNVEKAIHTVRQRNCRHCAPVVPAGMRDFGIVLTNKIEELISQVSLSATKHTGVI
ncbi:hypothetical protein BKA82DRAFT_997791 [Pisolithus tinctorius]|uniref:BTB domain-containing protein n=1 Tax=Pisolithus tinctorius Marx 270 TaxID=870435 RepID=A0A0C3PGU0_PISTI|nr:hypothetical protein BKA82DRAFT_997791 [Pisolithus tinctorius]KIO07611.1 hypothetical protein M404DRAFT_997791 [Pisolithus tinctorius Marx 270]